jgi:murein DD-endopeptidase MepM/ murein hydrolase activator NlpD
VTRDYFIKPVPCPLSQGRHDTYAVDMSCHTAGTPIKAAASGVVVRASEGWSGGYGNLVVIQHPNGMITFYAHMLNGSMKVSVGEHVTQGQVIGNVGSTGRSTGPHLHFEVRNGRNPGFDKTGTAWKQ